MLIFTVRDPFFHIPYLYRVFLCFTLMAKIFVKGERRISIKKIFRFLTPNKKITVYITNKKRVLIFANAQEALLEFFYTDNVRFFPGTPSILTIFAKNI
jgi:hypothetical protein